MKLTKKILEQLIKEEITLTGKAQAQQFLKLLSKKKKISMLKKVFKVLNKLNQFPLVPPPPFTGLYANYLSEQIIETYKKDGIDAALLKAAELIAEQIPIVGSIMDLDELIKYIAPKASKDFEAAKQFSLTTKNPATRRASEFMRFKDMIREELSLIEREILDPPPEFERAERYESQVPEATKILDKILGVQTGIFSDPCLKKQTTKNNFKKLLSTLPKLSTKNLEYLENELAYYIEYEKDDLKAKDGYRYQDKAKLQLKVDTYYEIEELINNISSGRMDLVSKEDKETMEAFISQGAFDIHSQADFLKFIKSGQESRIESINRLKRKVKENACKLRIYNRVYEAVSEINIQKAQAQSDKQKALGKRGGGEIIVYDKEGKPYRRLGVDTGGKMFDQTTNESKLKQIIKEELSKLTEGRKQYLCYQEWMDLKETDPREHEKLGRNMRRDFSRANIDDPTEAQMNRWLSKYGNCKHDPSVIDVFDVDKPQ